MRKWLLSLFALMSVATPALSQDVVIGLSSPMTGPAATAAEWEKWGVDLAVEEINAAGGVLGRKIAVMQLDNKCNPSERRQRRQQARRSQGGGDRRLALQFGASCGDADHQGREDPHDHGRCF